MVLNNRMLHSLNLDVVRSMLSRLFGLHDMLIFARNRDEWLLGGRCVEFCECLAEACGRQGDGPCL